MKIFGIGIDVIEVERIEEAVEEFGDRFLDRIFTSGERGYCSRQKRPAIHYAARWAAKNVVAAGLARRCEIQLAYAIGVVEPVSVHVTTFGTSELPEDVLSQAVAEVFDFRPSAIIDALGLRNPIFTPTAAYGHFGRTPETRVPDSSETGEEVRFFPWEDTNRVDELKTAAGA